MNEVIEGAPLRDHLEAAWQRTGVMPSQLANAPELPDGTEQLWSDFIALHESRGSSGFGPMRISFRDLQAWQDVTGARLEPWQIDCIRKADAAFIASLPKPKDS